MKHRFKLIDVICREYECSYRWGTEHGEVITGQNCGWFIKVTWRGYKDVEDPNIPNYDEVYIYEVQWGLWDVKGCNVLKTEKWEFWILFDKLLKWCLTGNLRWEGGGNGIKNPYVRSNTRDTHSLSRFVFLYYLFLFFLLEIKNPDFFSFKSSTLRAIGLE